MVFSDILILFFSEARGKKSMNSVLKMGLDMKIIKEWKGRLLKTIDIHQVRTIFAFLNSLIA
jgi:predicted thioredoxin/glutaredoxin